MTGQTGTGGNFCRFTVTDLTDQDNVRVLTQNGAQTSGKGHTGPQVNLGLADTGKIVFHRILNGHNIALLAIHLLQSRVERGGFTGTGGTGYKDDTVWHGDQLQQLSLGLLRHAQITGVLHSRILIQQTHHHPLTVTGGHGGYTQVNAATTRAARPYGHPGAGAARQYPAWTLP